MSAVPLSYAPVTNPTLSERGRRSGLGAPPPSTAQRPAAKPAAKASRTPASAPAPKSAAKAAQPPPVAPAAPASAPAPKSAAKAAQPPPVAPAKKPAKPRASATAAEPPAPGASVKAPAAPPPKVSAPPRDASPPAPTAPAKAACAPGRNSGVPSAPAPKPGPKTAPPNVDDDDAPPRRLDWSAPTFGLGQSEDSDLASDQSDAYDHGGDDEQGPPPRAASSPTRQRWWQLSVLHRMEEQADRALVLQEGATLANRHTILGNHARRLAERNEFQRTHLLGSRATFMIGFLGIADEHPPDSWADEMDDRPSYTEGDGGGGFPSGFAEYMQSAPPAPHSAPQQHVAASPVGGAPPPPPPPGGHGDTTTGGPPAPRRAHHGGGGGSGSPHGDSSPHGGSGGPPPPPPPPGGGAGSALGATLPLGPSVPAVRTDESVGRPTIKDPNLRWRIQHTRRFSHDPEGYVVVCAEVVELCMGGLDLRMSSIECYQERSNYLLEAPLLAQDTKELLAAVKSGAIPAGTRLASTSLTNIRMKERIVAELAALAEEKFLMLHKVAPRSRTTGLTCRCGCTRTR